MDFMNGIFQKTRANDLNQALLVLGEKNKVLSRNIANADTPMYKAQKLEFDEVMAEYFADDNKQKLYTTNPSHMQASRPSMSLSDGRHIATVVDNQVNIAGHIRNQNNPSLRTDGNDVNLDYEMSEQATTSILYGMLTQMAGGKFGTLKEIIRTR
jgi:flagellar basal-body rod protein FlgB